MDPKYHMSSLNSIYRHLKKLGCRIGVAIFKYLYYNETDIEVILSTLSEPVLKFI